MTEEEDRYYVSFGGGVNSVAMILWMLDNNQPITKAQFVDTGCEYPETYEYIRMFSDKIYPIKIINSADYNHGRNLLDECLKYNIVPSMRMRWCTEKFKIRPLIANQITPCFSVIGIAYDEAHRCRLSRTKGMENCYPLVENKITRSGCVKIIQNHNLPIPRKSGCWLCPMMPKSEIGNLRTYHHDLMCQLRKLEEDYIQLQTKRGKKKVGYWHASNKPLSAILNDNEGLLFEELQEQPCLCGR
jgi:3'-phosphoadenosine 5'-phosphosulfate sulfotransferase (PAPS reductase)/FAD synthetase